MKPPSKAKELQRARRDIDKYKESTQAAEPAKAQAKSELSDANNTVKSLFSMFEESSSKTKARMRDMTSVNKVGKVSMNGNNNEYSQVMRELDYAKKELFQLKLDMASVLEEKLRAEKQIKALRSNMQSGPRIAQELRKEIEEAGEEQVLVELARMPALEELKDIEARRDKEANEILFKSECTMNKLKKAIKEIEESKEIEKKLATTLSDIDVLKNELKLVKKLEKMVQRDQSMEHVESKESRDFPVLKTMKEDIEEAKKDLALIRAKGFEFMSSMDAIRNELQHATAETVHLKKVESKLVSKVQSLNSKLLRAKSKLEAVSASEEKAKSIVINLSHTLEKLKTEAEAAKTEKELINQEVTTNNEETKETELETDMAEERLLGAMQELEAVKSLEGLALEKLKTLTENAMGKRGLTTKPNSKITISKFEYEYLTNHAAKAEELADKKVAAAKAWIESVKTSGKEMVMKTKIAEMKLEVYTSNKEKMVSKRVINEELSRKREKNPSRELQRAMSRKSVQWDGNVTPSKGSRSLKSASPARHVSPFTIRKKKKVIPNLAKFFRGKRNNRIL